MDLFSKLASMMPGKRKLLKELEERKLEIEKTIALFDAQIHSLSENYIFSEQVSKLKNDYRDFYKSVADLAIPKEHDLYELISAFCNTYRNIEQIINSKNDEFTIRKSTEHDGLLSDIDGKSLDSQQRIAVLSPENRNLVIAGAGSGKTLTIAGKVKYLCEVEKLNPEEILLISFTRKSAQEMTERIVEKLGYNVQATTFHKLGLDILKSAKGKMYDVLDDLPAFLTEYFSTKINSNPRMLENIIRFFAYYLQIPADYSRYGSVGEAYEYEKSMDLESVKSKYDAATYAKMHMKYKQEDMLTLKSEQMKSSQEIAIANFLFLNGVRYEYEKLYPYQDEDTNMRAYHPDFYLPDYDIYLEHFGIDKYGHCPWLSNIEEKKYLEDMEWKRSWHRQHGTKLIETYSYYQHEGILLEKLEELLKANNVDFKPVDFNDIFNAVYVKQGKKYFSQFITLCSTFITLFKSGGNGPEELKTMASGNTLFDIPFLKNRTAVFLEIIEVLYDEYEAHLKEKKAFDFSDMINLATKTVEEGFKVPEYKYVIIDEFQDISIARYKLVKAILDQTGAKLMCVGDDWQSIYRFAGSDISLFTEFESYFGPTRIMRIEKTYRNSQELINAAGSFIMKNPKQITKTLRSDKHVDKPVIIRKCEGEVCEALADMVSKIIERNGRDKSILLLGRTNYDFEIIKKSGKFGGTSDKLVFVDSPSTPISFLTVHRSKGLEADNVILLNFENSTLGFPNKIADDPLLELVLSRSDSFAYAEERRLFYVAITRTKGQTFILMNAKKPSEFLKDIDAYIIGDNSVQVAEQQIACPKCKTGHLIKKVGPNRKVFYGCSNFPLCDYSATDVKAVESGKRCPMCGGFMSIRPNKYEAFYGCSNYPTCKYTEKAEDVPLCSECGAPMKLRKGKNGYFWGCSNYPGCKGVKKV